jgi:hypothetical protein
MSDKDDKDPGKVEGKDATNAGEPAEAEDTGSEREADEKDAASEPPPAAKDESDDDEAAGEKDAGDASTEKAEAGGGSGPPKPPERKAAAWGRPLARLDAAWTKWEVWLCAVTILLEVLTLTLWVALKGLSTAAVGSSKAGLVFRALTGAIVLGLAAWWGLKKQDGKVRRVATVVATVVGLFTAKLWGNALVDWSSNLLNWYQQASFLTLFGGLRGVGTRLTLLLALLGGSLATAAGKHITIDLLTRYLKPKARLPVVIAGWLAASVVCLTASWGFFDHISIDDFDARAEMRPSEKFATVFHRLGEDWFIARKQLSLDVTSIPHVFKGQTYSDWMTAQEWNTWVDEAGFAERYGKDKAELLKLPPDMKRAPMVIIPDKGEPRNEFVNAANLVFPIGLLIISLRFILLCLLALSGHKNVDPEAHAEIGVIPGGKLDAHSDAEAAKEDG